MAADVDGQARAEMRRISRALTGMAPYRLEIALAVTQLRPSFTVSEVSALLPSGEISKTHNISRNLQAFVEAGFLRQAEPGGPYERQDVAFWTFISKTWAECIAAVAARAPASRR